MRVREFAKLEGHTPDPETIEIFVGRRERVTTPAPRYVYHSLRGRKLGSDGSIPGYPLSSRERELEDDFKEPSKDGYVWLSPRPYTSEAMKIDAAKLDPRNLRYTGQAEGNLIHRGSIPADAIIKTSDEEINEEANFLDLYRRFSGNVNKDLLKTGGEKLAGDYTWLKSYDTSGKGEHEYEQHPKQSVVSALDRHTSDEANALEKPVTSYSGVNLEFGEKLKELSKTPGYKIKSPAFISSSHDPAIARKFAERDNNGNQHVMVFDLPAGFSKSKSIPNAREGGKSKSDERLIARNTEFVHTGSNKVGAVTYHHFKPA